MENHYRAEFLVHEVICHKKTVGKPAVFFKLFDLDPIVIKGRYQGKLVFSNGNSGYFSMNTFKLMNFMKTKPLKIGLIEAVHTPAKLVGSTQVQLQLTQVSETPDFQRKIFTLYDPLRNKIGSIDFSMSISIQKPYEKTKRTEEKKEEIENEPMLSIFNEVYQPPPMFLNCKPEEDIPSSVNLQPVLTSNDKDSSISELVSSFQKSSAYLPTLPFIEPMRKQPSFNRSISKKVSISEYSEDFEEDSSEHYTSKIREEITISQSFRETIQEEYESDFEEESFNY